MAKFSASIYFPDLVGSIGGLTIQNNLSGPTIRIKPQRTKNTTAKQETEIQVFSNISQQWRQLTRAEKILWDTFAQANQHTTLYNQVRTISGQNFFILCNYNLVSSGQAGITTPPAYTIPALAASITVQVSSTSITLSLVGATLNVGDMVMIFATQTLGGLNSPPRKDLRLIKYFLYAGVDDIDITADWELYFGLDSELDIYDVSGQIWCAASCFDVTVGIPGPLIFCENTFTASAFDTLSIAIGNTVSELRNDDPFLPPTFNTLGELSISFWIKTFGAPTERTLIFFGEEIAASENYIRVSSTNTDRITFSIAAGPGNLATLQTTNPILAAGFWRHIAITKDNTRDPNNWQIYLDGVSEAVTVISNTLAADIANIDVLTIFNNIIFEGGYNPFCNLDEFAIYGSFLTNPEVVQIWNAGVPSDLTLYPSGAFLQTWWRMGEGSTFPTIIDEMGLFDMTMINLSPLDIVADVP